MEQFQSPKKKVILNNYDLSDGDTSVSLNLLSHPRINLQAVWSELDGTGVLINLYQSSDGTNWDIMKTLNTENEYVDWVISFTSETGSYTIQDDGCFGSNYLKITVTNTAVDAGILTLILNTY